MILIIDLSQEPKLILKKGQRIIDTLQWPGLYQLSETLLEQIDGLLKRNQLTLEQIKKIKVKPSQQSLVSTRLAQAMALGLKSKI